MFALAINRNRTTKLSPKELLRHHIDALSLDQQWEFIASALQLMAARPQLRQAEVIINEPRVFQPQRRTSYW
jgi:hypothetical protein